MSRGKSNETSWRKWEEKRAHSLRSGKDLKAWRQRLGLYMGEVGELLGLHHTTISVAEKSAKVSPGVKRAVLLLQEAIDAGEIDLEKITAKRKPRGRPRK